MWNCVNSRHPIDKKMQSFKFLLIHPRPVEIEKEVFLWMENKTGCRKYCSWM